MKRKEFLTTAARVSLFGALAVVTGLLAGRRQLTTGSCSENLACNHCSKQKRCELPEAKAFRKHG